MVQATIVFQVFRTSPYPDLGVLYLASVIRKQQPDWKVIVEHNADQATILAHKPTVVGLSFTSADFNKAKTLAQQLSIRNIPVVVGGIHMTNNPETLCKDMYAGMCGEGENTIVAFLSAVMSKDTTVLEKIPGSIYHTPQGVVSNKPELVRNLDTIPLPSRDLVPATFWSTGITSLLTSRGCKYRCSFCQVSSTWKYPRFHSAEYVCEEICRVSKDFHIHTFGIIDDLFVSNIQRIEDLVALLEQRRMLGKVGFAVNGRANLITDELCVLLARMGVREVALGLESMSPRILSLLKDRVTVDDNKYAVETLYKHGLKTGGLFMVGTPTETEQDLEQTYRYVYDNRHKFGGLQVCVTTPLPNTKLWDMCVEQGKISSVPDWDKMNIAAENISTNTYIGDVQPSRFNTILHNFRTLFFGKLENAPQTAIASIVPWSACKITGLQPDGWTSGMLEVYTDLAALEDTTLTIVLNDLRPTEPTIRVCINDVEVPSESSRTCINAVIPAGTADVRIKILSDIFVPSAHGINTDDRQLGINIKGMSTAPSLTAVASGARDV